MYHILSADVESCSGSGNYGCRIMTRMCRLSVIFYSLIPWRTKYFPYRFGKLNYGAFESVSGHPL